MPRHIGIWLRLTNCGPNLVLSPAGCFLANTKPHPIFRSRWIPWGTPGRGGRVSPVLQELLTAEEWEPARASAVNAHFTSETVVSGIWKGVEHLGFDDGRALEPTAGAGHFMGLIPGALKLPRSSFAVPILKRMEFRRTHSKIWRAFAWSGSASRSIRPR